MSTAHDNALRGQKLGDILLALGVIDASQLRAALIHARQWDQPMGRSLIALGFCTEAAVVKARSLKFGLPSIRLSTLNIDADVLDLVGATIAEHHHVIPLSVMPGVPRGTLHLALSNPEDLEAISTVEFAAGMKVTPVLAGDADLMAAVRRMYGAGLEYLPAVQEYIESTPAEDTDTTTVIYAQSSRFALMLTNDKR